RRSPPTPLLPLRATGPHDPAITPLPLASSPGRPAVRAAQSRYRAFVTGSGVAFACRASETGARIERALVGADGAPVYSEDWQASPGELTVEVMRRQGDLRDARPYEELPRHRRSRNRGSVRRSRDRAALRATFAP